MANRKWLPLLRGASGSRSPESLPMRDQRKCIAPRRRCATSCAASIIAFSSHLPDRFAQIAIEHGRQRPGYNALRRGLELGRQYGYAHFFWWRRAPGAGADAPHSNGIQPDYARSLISGARWCGAAAAFGRRLALTYACRPRRLRLMRTTRRWRPGQGAAPAARPAEVLISYGRRARQRKAASPTRSGRAIDRRLGAPRVHQRLASPAQAPRRDRAVVAARRKLTLDCHSSWVAAGVPHWRQDAADRAARDRRRMTRASRLQDHAMHPRT